ncbi:MAG: ZIP family metal transporter [Candidatus Blackburnbacteria bacterium]|nr:ZIP family metal transporter [Candidatus Blackburnbacteria bacterium]
METLLPVFGLATLGSLAGLLGGLIILSQKALGKTISTHAIPFAAGVLLGVSFLDVLPEAIDHTGVELGLQVVLIVIISAFFFEQFLLHLHHHEKSGGSSLKASLPLVVAGDTIHNFMDGVAIAASYLVNPAFGLVVAVATFLHEIPHEMGDFSLMIKAGWSRLKVMAVNIFSALATYLGVAFVFLFQNFSEKNLGVLLAIAGGLFLYIGASDLLPELEEEKRNNHWYQALLLISGVIIVWIFNQVLPR